MDFNEKSKSVINEYKYDDGADNSVRVTYIDHKLARIEGKIDGKDVLFHGDKQFWSTSNKQIQGYLKALSFLGSLRTAIVDLDAIHLDNLQKGRDNG
jgi:hypothetical protein